MDYLYYARALRGANWELRQLQLEISYVWGADP